MSVAVAAAPLPPARCADLSVVPMEKIILSNPWRQPGQSSADALLKWAKPGPIRLRYLSPRGEGEIEDSTGCED